MRIAVTTTSQDRIKAAQQLATDLRLKLIADPHDKTHDFLLVYTPEYLGIQRTADKRFAPFYIDFLSGKMLYRSKQAGLRKELLARAIGQKPGDRPYIIDATAGLGRDSFILATLGFEVTMLERSPILHALLADGLKRAANDPDIAPITGRLTLIHANAIEWLQRVPDNQIPDVIYLDPMFPSRQKSASVKKEMVFLQELLGKDIDADALFNVALSCAAKRVVVKRPRLAANIAERAANFTMAGKSSRFDIYLK